MSSILPIGSLKPAVAGSATNDCNITGNAMTPNLFTMVVIGYLKTFLGDRLDRRKDRLGIAGGCGSRRAARGRFVPAAATAGPNKAEQDEGGKNIRKTSTHWVLLWLLRGGQSVAEVCGCDCRCRSGPGGLRSRVIAAADLGDGVLGDRCDYGPSVRCAPG